MYSCFRQYFFDWFCQWQVTFWKMMVKMPAAITTIRLDLTEDDPSWKEKWIKNIERVQVCYVNFILERKNVYLSIFSIIPNDEFL